MTPEQIIGADAVRALAAAGYQITPMQSKLPALAGFELWWKAFPNKVGKGAAEQAFKKAIRLASIEVLLDGVMRYAAKRDDRPWCNPATWLNQRRWEDEPATVSVVKGADLFFQSAQGDLDGRNRGNQGDTGYAAGRLQLAGHAGNR